MATTNSWVAPIAIATALDTQLNALANAAFTAASTAYDNETNHHLYLDVELTLASLTPTGTPSCALFLVYSLDSGTTFEDVSNLSSIPVAIFPFTTAVAAKRQNRVNILVAPLQFKFVLQNNMGPALGATLNTVRFRLHDEQSV